MIPLTKAPQRVIARSRSSFPAANITRAARATPSASTGAVIAITASETTSFVVRVFMRILLVTFFSFFATRPCFANDYVLNKERAIAQKTENTRKTALLWSRWPLSCRPGFTRTMDQAREERGSEGDQAAFCSTIELSPEVNNPRWSCTRWGDRPAAQKKKHSRLFSNASRNPYWAFCLVPR